MEIWGLCVIDAGPGHVCWREGEQILRTEIENQIRVKFVVLGGKQSSCLNAMDQLHQLLRANHKIWCKLHFKDYDCLYLRPAPGSEDRAANGAINLGMSMLIYMPPPATHTNKQPTKQANKPSNKQTNKQQNKQPTKQASNQTNKHTHTRRTSK